MTVTEAISKSSLISRHITNWVFTLCCSSCLSAVVAYLVLSSGCRNACFGKLPMLFEKLPVYFVVDV
jgi:hypothetical protein